MKKLQKQIETMSEMATSKEKQKEFNEQMVKLTWHYQKIYGFETRNKKGNEFWNNEADAFKHTFGSALMTFSMGDFGSLAGGINHEISTKNNPPDEWNMDSWNNHQGRLIAKEIKKEYGEDNFLKLTRKKREDIIAHKVMVKMKNGELITNPNDKRNYKGKPENMVNNLKQTIENIKDKFQDMKQNGLKIDFKNVSYDGKKWNKWSDDEKESFMEGFETGEIVTRKKEKKDNWTKKFNIGNPASDKGHWVTLENGKHLFIKDS